MKDTPITGIEVCPTKDAILISGDNHHLLKYSYVSKEMSTHSQTIFPQLRVWGNAILVAQGSKVTMYNYD